MASTFQGLAKWWVIQLLPGISTSWEPLSDSPLGYILRNENFYPAEDLAPVQTGGPQKKTWPLNGTLAFAKSRGRTQNFLTFCCLPVSCPPLSPSDFLDDPYSTFHIHMTSWKEFWGSLWSRSFPILKKPEGSKTNILKNPLLTKLISQVGRELSFPSSWPS